MNLDKNTLVSVSIKVIRSICIAFALAYICLGITRIGKLSGTRVEVELTNSNLVGVQNVLQKAPEAFHHALTKRVGFPDKNDKFINFHLNRVPQKELLIVLTYDKTRPPPAVRSITFVNEKNEILKRWAGPDLAANFVNVPPESITGRTKTQETNQDKLILRNVNDLTSFLRDYSSDYLSLLGVFFIAFLTISLLYDFQARFQSQVQEFLSYKRNLFIFPPIVAAIILSCMDINYPVDEVSDIAIQSLYAFKAESFEQFLGSFSFKKFHHPGPVSFYLYAFFQKTLWFIEPGVQRYEVGQFLLNILALIMSLYIIFASVKRKHYIMSFLLLFWFVMGALALSPRTLFSIWSPDFIIVPMVLFVLAAVSIARGELRFLAVFSISATIIVQGYVGTIVLIGLVGLLAIILFGYNRRGHIIEELKTNKIHLFVSLVILIICFFPVLYQQFTADKGNLTKLWEFFGAAKNESFFPHSFREARAFIFWYFTLGLGLEKPGLIINLILILSCFNLRRTPDFLSYLTIFNFLALLAGVFSAMKINEVLLNHFLRFEYGLLVLFLFTAFTGILRIFRILLKQDMVITSAPEESIKPVNGYGINIIIYSLGILILVGLFVPAGRYNYNYGRDYYSFKKDFDATLSLLKPEKDKLYKLECNYGCDGAVMGLLLRFEREGLRVCVGEEVKHYLSDKKNLCKSGQKLTRLLIYDNSRPPHNREFTKLEFFLLSIERDVINAEPGSGEK